MQPRNATAPIARGVLFPNSANFLAPSFFTTSEALKDLTASERRVLPLLAAGFTDGEIAQALGQPTETVRRHTKSILRKLSLHERGRIPHALYGILRRLTQNRPIFAVDFPPGGRSNWGSE